MKILKLIILTFLFVGVSNKSFSQDTIHWSPCYKLKWEDFKETPDSTSEYGAISACNIIYKTSVRNDRLIFSVLCFFEKRKSWKQNGVTSSTLLKHEQGHFDIAEYFARKLRQEFKNYKPEHSTFKNDIKNIFQKILNEKIQIDTQYDNETSFSTNTLIQLQWEKKIQTMLNSLSEFSAK